MSAQESRYVKGMEKFTQLNPEAAAQIPPALAEIAPDMARFLAEFCFHDLYTREGLDPRLRQAATLAALVATGVKDHQLKVHIDVASNMGFTREEIVEIFMQLSAYVGFPAAINAIMVTKRAFEEEST